MQILTSSQRERQERDNMRSQAGRSGICGRGFLANFAAAAAEIAASVGEGEEEGESCKGDHLRSCDTEKQAHRGFPNVIVRRRGREER
jgi:hypothetical protein